MVNDKLLLAKEFLFLSSEDITINKFIKLPPDIMSYETIRSAFIIPITGRAEIYFADQKFIAAPGNIIHGCPNKRLTFKVLGNEPFHHINIYYSSISSSGNYSNSAFEFIIDDFSKLNTILEEFYIICNSKNRKNQLKKELLFQSLINTLFSSPKSIDINQKLIENSVTYIEENYYSQITLQSLADKYNKSPQQFSYLFHKYMDIRPIDYIIQCRLKKALGMLNEGYKVKETASYVGYDDPYYFSRLFKKHFSLSPSQVIKMKF